MSYMKGRSRSSGYLIPGKGQVLRVLGPGEFMGELTLFSHNPLTDNAEALEKNCSMRYKWRRMQKSYVQVSDHCL